MLTHLFFWLSVMVTTKEIRGDKELIEFGIKDIENQE